MDLKIALCTIYNDNILDIKEWVEWNKNIGISKIFIYENNINNKKYESIKDYISGCFVEIINIKSINNEINDLKSNCFIDFYEGQGKDYDWICFLGINDFLMFNDNLDLFSFLNKKEFINQDLILVSLENHNHFVKSIVRSGRKILDKFQNNLSSIFRLENDNTIYSAGLRLRDKRNHYDIPNRIHRLASCYIDNRYQVEIKEDELKVALCAIAKNENLYIREWVGWYKNLGISKIFLYDNNEIDGERFEEVINDYIESGFVEIKNWRGIVKSVKSDKDGQTTQGLAYSDCYYNNYKKYDWICFFDIDEYLEIYYKYDNLNDFLNDFNDYDGIRVQWKMYGDNEKLYYENKSIFERFKYEKNSSYDKHVKQILKCKEYDTNLLFCAHGVINKKYNFVNVLKTKPRNVYMDYVEHKNLPVYLNHFYSKSTEEFLKRKYNKTSAVTGVNNTRNFNIEFLKTQYFEHNKMTEEKQKMFNNYNELKDAKNYDNIIISFTSYKERLSSCHLMVESLLKNTIKPYKICLTIYIDDIIYLSDKLKNMVKNNILELIVADKNLRPHLKYFYTMQKYRDYPIITVDDDCIFKEDFIKSLIDSYKKYPNCVSARRVHKKTYDLLDGKINNYEKWIRPYTKILLPSVDIVATGVGGVLYPPNILNITDDNLEDIYKYITVDDIYLHYLELKNNIPIVYVQNKKNHPDIIEGSQATALFINVNKANESDDNSPNNVAIRNLLNHI